MNRKSIPARPDACARVRVRALAALVAAAALTACGGGGGSGGTPAPKPVLSADQKIYEDAALQGGVDSIGYNMPYGGGALVSGTNWLNSVADAIQVSPLSAGPQTVTPALASLDPALALPTQSKSWYLAGGQVIGRSGTANLQVTYSGASVQVAQYADDNQTVVAAYNESGFREVPLTGPVAGAPTEFLAVLPLDQWTAAGNFSAGTVWQPGAFYIARTETLVNDRIALESCYPAPDMPAASTAAKVQPCGSTASLSALFPLTIYPSGNSHPRETFAATDGSVTTVQGLQVWTANQPESRGVYPTTAYRVFVQQGGAVYTGVVQRQGTPIATTLTDGSVVGETFAFNRATIATVAQGVVTFPSAPGATAGILRNLPTLDLIGIGGTGVDGSLSPRDLRTHYDVPASLDGTGQTIAVVDAPGPANINYVDDLAAYSQAFGLPLCANAAGSCFTHVDLSNGGFSGTGNGGAVEATLDIEMVHAIAPGAHIVLVTASSSNLADMIAAVNYAASLPQVSAVSASWSYSYPANASAIVNEETQLAQFVAQGKVFFASSGDAG